MKRWFGKKKGPAGSGESEIVKKIKGQSVFALIPTHTLPYTSLLMEKERLARAATLSGLSRRCTPCSPRPG